MHIDSGLVVGIVAILFMAVSVVAMGALFVFVLSRVGSGKVRSDVLGGPIVATIGELTAAPRALHVTTLRVSQVRHAGELGVGFELELTGPGYLLAGVRLDADQARNVADALERASVA